jgi:hypothetical protein
MDAQRVGTSRVCWEFRMYETPNVDYKWFDEPMNANKKFIQNIVFSELYEAQTLRMGRWVVGALTSKFCGRGPSHDFWIWDFPHFFDPLISQ